MGKFYLFSPTSLKFSKEYELIKPVIHGPYDTIDRPLEVKEIIERDPKLRDQLVILQEVVYE